MVATPHEPQPCSEPHNYTPHQAGTRFRVLVTQDRTHAEEHWTRQLPRLLSPMGVDATLVANGDQALSHIEREAIHVAVIDISTPTGRHPASPQPGGLWLMEMIQRLPKQPAVILINTRCWSQIELNHALHEALRLQAFSVINAPVQIDHILQTFRRLLELRYSGHWPQSL